MLQSKSFVDLTTRSSGQNENLERDRELRAKESSRIRGLFSDLERKTQMINLKKKNALTATALAVVLGASILASGCSNPTSTAGRVSYFTEGVITDVEYITLDLNKYDTTKTAAVGAAAGAAAGQIWGKDTKSTLIGAGIGALLSAGASALMDRTSDGARLTINTNQGLVLVDQPFSCNYQRGAKVRLINQSDNTVQIQVLVNGTYRTAETNSPKECSL